MFKIVSKTGDLYDVLDTSDGVVESVSGSALVKYMQSGVSISGCHWSKSRLLTEIDGMYHAKPQKEGQKYAFVQDNRGILLSPTKEEKAWYLVRKGKAKVLEMNPLAIQLKREQDNTDKSRFVIGIDPGDTTGIAVVQEGGSCNKAVFRAEIQHRKDVSKKIGQRRDYRRARRSEKRHRPARFNNRASSRKEGRVAPSIRHRKDEVLRLVRYLVKRIGISGICCEDVAFDVRALADGYKPYGRQYRVSNRLDENIRKAVVLRDGCKCRRCGVSNGRLEVHHIVPRRHNGSNTLGNLITLCNGCHSLVTGNEGNFESYFQSLINGSEVSIRPAMHVMQGKSYLYSQLDMLCPLELCAGGDTANRRIDWGIPKSHTNDAACVTRIRCTPDNLRTYCYTIKPLCRKLKTKQDTSGKAIRHRDLVWYTPRGRNSIKCYVIGILVSGRFAGYYKLKSLDGEQFGPVSVNSLKLISSSQFGMLFA